MSSTHALEWSAAFSVGLPDIDAQHAEIFSRILAFKGACAEGAAAGQLHEVIAYLRGYVHEHFGAEESYQESIGFPGLVEHKRMHNAFAQEIDRYAARLTAHGASAALGEEVSRFMLNWLAVHVVVEDQKYVDHARIAG